MKQQWLFIILINLCVFTDTSGLTIHPDSLASESFKTELFYDSLKTKAYRNGFTKLVYSAVVNGKSSDDGLSVQYEILQKLQGKTITSIKLIRLDVFGPSFQDTTKAARTKVGAFGNKLHTKTNQRIIRKSLVVEVGDTLNVDEILENERIIRTLPFIKDVRFLAVENQLDSSQVELTVLTKDVFAFGVGGRLNGIESASLEMYNKNIWGIGHQISAKVIGNKDDEPYVGVEGFYTINNINGDFINLTLGYANTYKREGILFAFDKEFIQTTTKWGGGLAAYRLLRSDRLVDNNQVPVESPLDYSTIDAWSGYSFQLNNNRPTKKLQLIVSGRIRHLKFFERPESGIDNNQYFANSNMYLGSISLSRRTYVRDELVYSYGITEDIPKGFLHEWVLGYDDNEFVKRWHSHLYFSTGNILGNKPIYLFASAGVGSFFNANRMEQGMAELNVNYISRLFNIGSQQVRQFLNLRFIYGINRFEQENLYLGNGRGIRGFRSAEAIGKQRLSLNAETVFFQKKNILDFNFAFYGFADVGVIGPSETSIFNENCYAGIGTGIRIRSESLVFNTLQLCLAYYPMHPSDVDDFGVTFTERSKSRFYSFQARRPDPLIYR